MKEAHKKRMTKKFDSIYKSLSSGITPVRRQKIMTEIAVIDKLFAIGKSRNIKDKDYRKCYKLWLKVRWKIMKYLAEKKAKKHGILQKK